MKRQKRQEEDRRGIGRYNSESQKNKMKEDGEETKPKGGGEEEEKKRRGQIRNKVGIRRI